MRSLYGKPCWLKVRSNIQHIHVVLYSVYTLFLRWVTLPNFKSLKDRSLQQVPAVSHIGYPSFHILDTRHFTYRVPAISHISFHFNQY
ncbi:hypothetical protein RclHR1_19350003 [Rhizophagus clarus]|uniref:Uncharacterized protein n=1 Tax=Rhizophagus clarus TaxID=94130 RepID=A0A2Z6QP70_9GLOM|nr:hypothetical protein RclHR1_19350003 [Rhizophagus clarus]